MLVGSSRCDVSASSHCGESISVCLLTYNHVNVIESTLRSIQRQTINGYEIIVSDDCSDDGTWEKILNVAAGDSRIRLVRTPRNLGMPGNANFAVSQSNRKYIALLHHDDIYCENLLERWGFIIENNPDIGFVFNAYGTYESSKVYKEEILGQQIDGRSFLERFLFPRWGCPVRGTAMIRREAWIGVGGMSEQFGLLADIDLWMRLAMSWNVGYVPEPIIVVRYQRPDYYPVIYSDQEVSWKDIVICMKYTPLTAKDI
jgi:glycosyltransferase involved in cell wall biosynthesis